MDADAANREEEALKSWAADLSGRSRKDRQAAAHAMALASAAVPQKIAAYADVLVSAAGRPEAQTRWDAFDALARIAPYAPEEAFEAYDAAEAGLFDDESGLVRLNSFKFLVSVGSVGPEWSRKVWDLVDEGIQCLHGDPEFEEMLTALVTFVQCDIDPSVRQALVDRLAFDAQGSKGATARLARKIIELAH